MKQCFDWNNNILNISDLNDNVFNLKFKGLKTIVTGKSATGKSLLCSIIREIQNDKNIVGKKYDASNLFLVTEENMYNIKNIQGKLIIIDRADIILDSEVINMINNDWGYNKYLIFSRRPLGIDLSPNYFAELEEKDKVFSLKYMFNKKEWN